MNEIEQLTKRIDELENKTNTRLLSPNLLVRGITIVAYYLFTLSLTVIVLGAIGFLLGLFN